MDDGFRLLLTALATVAIWGISALGGRRNRSEQVDEAITRILNEDE